MPRTAVIVGAGIGGLAAGVALRRAGWEIRIVERAASPGELGFALALAPNALNALREIGVIDAVARDGVEVRLFELRRADGAVLKRFDFGASPGAARSLITLRPALHGALLEAAGADALLLGREAESVVSSPAGVEVRLADGFQVRGDVAIGADGVGSVFGGGSIGRTARARSGYCAARRDLAPPRARRRQRVVYPGRHRGRPRASVLVYWYLSLVTSRAGELRRTPSDRAPRSRSALASIARAALPQDHAADRPWIREPIADWGAAPDPARRCRSSGAAAHRAGRRGARGRRGAGLVLSQMPSRSGVAPLRTRQIGQTARRPRRPRIAAMTTTRAG